MAGIADVEGMADRYFIRDGYVSRPKPDYFVDIDAETGLICQPDVYVDAASVAGRLGARRIVDIGCGNGYKLSQMHPAFEITGIDFGTNLDTCRQLYPFGTWLEHDLDADEPLPLADDDVADALIVCSDVIEHLVRPELLLRKLQRAFARGAVGALVSTPERELTWGPLHVGPPPNPHHVREWSIDEFAALLESEGFEHGDVGLTRNNNQHNELKNILAVLFRDAAGYELVYGSHSSEHDDGSWQQPVAG